MKRSSTNKIMGGVCGGIGESLNIDPNIIRLIWTIAMFSKFGLLLYIACWMAFSEK